MRIEGVIATTASVTQTPLKPQETQPKEATERAVTNAASVPKDQDQAVGDKLLNQAVNQANDLMAAFDEVLTIKVHKDTKRFMIKLVNGQTGEVIREYPPEKFLDMMANFQKQLAGLFVDTER